MGEEVEARLARELLGAPPKARLYRVYEESGTASWVAEIEGTGRRATGATRSEALRNLRPKIASRPVGQIKRARPAV